ncbi:MAG TPA: PhnD/SsuA/transferrin family substrate-binding protein [Vicinamibacterales bacterium]|jgi:ABC-type phosphate/phosphonate transport system substrate-binding protein
MSTTRARTRLVVECAAVVLACACVLSANVREQDRGPLTDRPTTSFLRVGFVDAVFGEVNHNDARAALKAWSQRVIAAAGLAFEGDVKLFGDSAALKAAVDAGAIDIIVIETAEYLRVFTQTSRRDWILAAERRGTPFESFVLLTRVDSGIRQFKDLRGRDVLVVGNALGGLVGSWLDVLTGKEGDRIAAEFFGVINKRTQVSKAVLPVFFRQAAACVVTRAAYQTMCELNPQLGHQLRIVAESAPVVTGIACLVRHYDPKVQDRIEQAVLNLNVSPGGQQVMTLFQFDKLVRQPPTCLDSARSLLEEQSRQYVRLKRAAPGAGVAK